MKPGPSGPLLVLPGGFQQHGARAVAEQHAGGAVRVVDNAAHGVGADHQNFLVGARRHQVRAGDQAVDETGAGGDQVETPGAFRAQRMLHQAGGGGKHHVGRHGADDDGVQFGGFDAALRQSAPRGGDRHIRRGLVRAGDMALADAGARHDPLVAGRDHLLEVLIG